MLCTMCLPPSTTISVVATAASSGSESLAVSISAFGNALAMIATPTLMHLLVVTATHTSKGLRPFIAQFSLSVVIPLIGGLAVQFASLSLTRRPPEELKRHVTTATSMCSEVCDTNATNWRGRVRGVVILVMLFLNYTFFSSLFFHPKSLEGKISLLAVLYVSGVLMCVHVVLGILAWVASSCLSLTPEDRIAVLFSSVQKSEILAVPLLSQMFLNDEHLAILLVPALSYHFLQSMCSGILGYPLRKWRNAQHCRPGTSLLPMRYCRVPRHLAALTPDRTQEKVVGKK